MMTKFSNILNYLTISFIIFSTNFDLSSAFVKHQYDCSIKALNSNLTKLNETLNYEVEVQESLEANKTKRNVEEFYYRKTGDYYQCPGQSYPENYIVCCQENKCCPVKINYIIFPITKNDLPYIIVIVVLLALFFSILTFGLCCFWSVCPLYNSCRIRYYGDSSSCTKMGEAPVDFSMPGEETKISGNTYVIHKKFDSDLIEEKKIVNIDDSVFKPSAV